MTIEEVDRPSERPRRPDRLAFPCPHCGTFAHHARSDLMRLPKFGMTIPVESTLRDLWGGKA
jgi:hypothetical protein